jgi:sec-independent protein translocase protein TatC
MPFLDHLEELRWRIFKVASALVVALGVGWYVVRRFRVTTLLVEPMGPYATEGKLHAFRPTTGFFLELKLALVVGLLLAFPVIVYQIWAFLAPALEKRERRVIVPSLYMGTILFAVGAALAYWIALPVSLRFLFGFQQDFLSLTIGADEYLSFVVRLLIGFGLVFELPVVVLILSVLGLVTPRFLRAKRRHAVVLITVTASFLSPGDVIMVTLLMMVPLILLYEFSILLSVLVTRSREREEEERTIGPDSGPAEGAVEAR